MIVTSSQPPVRVVTPRGRLIGLAVFCGLVTVMGIVVFAVSPTTPLNIIVGAAAIGVCGLGGGFSLVGQFRRSTLLVADDDGVRIEGRVSVPWSAIDRFGVAGSALGIRLRSSSALTDAAPKAYSTDGLRATRAASGYDLTWEERLLDRPAKEAAAALKARRP